MISKFYNLFKNKEKKKSAAKATYTPYTALRLTWLQKIIDALGRLPGFPHSGLDDGGVAPHVHHQPILERHAEDDPQAEQEKRTHRFAHVGASQ